MFKYVIYDVDLVLLSLTLNIFHHFVSSSIVDVEQVNVIWDTN